ncbi:MAG: hypothetical protein ACOC7T_04825 [Planctomycetota bacterium]
MKQTPQLQAVQRRMQPGAIVKDGFLGEDRRSLAEILEEDQNTVSSLGLTHEQIADRMEYFTEKGKRGLGTTVTVDDDYEVRVQSVRGFLPCPWGHKGLYPKLNVFLKNLINGEELTWTGLEVHLIREHGFYQGRGSYFRIEPERAARALGL